MNTIVITEDVANCPQCGAEAVKLGPNQRNCNACGLTWEVCTEEDELDAQADRLVRSRGWNEDREGKREIGRFQKRW